MKTTIPPGCTRILLIFVFNFLLQSVFAQSEVYISDGFCDARNIDLSAHRVQLSGRWKFFPNQLISPSDISFAQPHVISVPSIWEKGANESTGISHGTYLLEILINRKNEALALEMPQLYNSYRLIINDSLVGENGIPASTKEESVPQWKPQVINFTPASDTLRIVLQLSNFHHFKGGIREPIYLGTAAEIQSHFFSAYISTLIEVSLILVLSLFFFYLWLVRKSRTICLHFALFCLCWAIRELFSDIYPISDLIPDINWFLLVRTEYITLFLIMIFATLFLSKLFGKTNPTFKFLIIFINIVFILFTLLTPVPIFTRWINLYLMMSVVTLCFAVVEIVRAFIQDKTGAWALIGGVALMIMTTAYDLVAYKGVVVNNVLVANIGYCLILGACAIGLLQHLEIIGSGDSQDNRLRYQDLYQ